jgi:hypothetical protein
MWKTFARTIPVEKRDRKPQKSTVAKVCRTKDCNTLDQKKHVAYGHSQRAVILRVKEERILGKEQYRTLPNVRD